jgi:hypothetical protein
VDTAATEGDAKKVVKQGAADRWLADRGTRLARPEWLAAKAASVAKPKAAMVAKRARPTRVDLAETRARARATRRAERAEKADRPATPVKLDVEGSDPAVKAEAPETQRPPAFVTTTRRFSQNV